MDNLNYNSYNDEGWQNLSTPVIKSECVKDDFTADESLAPIKSKKQRKHPVLTLQLTLSLCALLFIFILKFLSVPLYEEIITWYERAISESVIYNYDFENLYFASIFATPDEV